MKNIKCRFTRNCFQCGEIGHGIPECCSKKVVDEKANAAVGKEKDGEQVEFMFDSV